MIAHASEDILTAAVTILAVLAYFWTVWNVGAMRGKHGIEAPAITGHPEFDRAYRVQLNTLEQIVIALPLLWPAAIYFRSIGWLPPLFGLVWVIGRVLYMQGYMSDPAKRSTGFLISGVAIIGLLVLSIVGIVQAWTATHAV